MPKKPATGEECKQSGECRMTARLVIYCQTCNVETHYVLSHEAMHALLDYLDSFEPKTESEPNVEEKPDLENLN